MVELEDFGGCMIKRNLTKTTLKISQPRLINNMTQVFNKYTKLLMTLNTSATPHQGIVHNKETNKNISFNLQKRYRSGAGSLLYLVKYSQLELSNTVRETYKFMDEANRSHYKDILRAIKYVIDTKYYYYQIKPDRDLNVL